MPEADVIARMYSPEYVTEHYAGELHGDDGDGELPRERNAVIARIRRARPSARVLDVGCGSGRFITHARSAGLACEGFELDADSARVASEKTGARVHYGHLGTIAERFDIVHMADVLEHHPRPIELLVEARKLLTDGGEIVARGPLEANANLFFVLMKAKRRIRGGRVFDLPPWHLIQFTSAGWARLAERAGLRFMTNEVYEVHWPVPERFSWTPSCVVRRTSMRLSATRIGARLSLGNRVVSSFAP